MSRHRLMLATAAALLLPVACSHQQEAKQTVRVATAAPPAARPPAPKSPSAAEQMEPLATKPDDAIYFDFDSSVLRDDARPILQRVADSLQRLRSSLRIEGNCDEAGTVEYNLALGEQRARAAKEYLVRLGVSPEKIATVTYGAQRPKYPGHDETAHAKNRRDDILVR